MRSTKMKLLHFIPKAITNPSHQITVNVIGCGGTGSKILTNLAMINAARISRKEAPLDVSAYDSDVVSGANIGRQVFSPSDIGKNKAEVLISRINRFYGFGWDSFDNNYTEESGDNPANITITCTDTISSRKSVRNKLIANHQVNSDYFNPLYWIDCGNLQKTGQVILSSVKSITQPWSQFETLDKLKNPFEIYPELETEKDDHLIPSCSMQESLLKQDLFINTIIADYAGTLLWSLLREPFLDYQGFFINLKSIKPIYLWEK